MPGHVNTGSVEITGAKRPLRSAAARRTTPASAGARAAVRRSQRGGGGAGEEAGVVRGKGLVEWHDLTPGEQAAEWAGLRAWVTWLHDRYELATEERLPRCWARHPGLVEELRALRAWRAEVYGGGQPSGQAARYWHAELRQLLAAATGMYAAGCRTGHRGAPLLAAGEPELLEDWATAYPLAGVPGIDVAAGRARIAGECLDAAVIAAALDSGDARPVPGLRDYVGYAGTWWVPAASGWIQVPAPPLGGAGSPFPPAGDPFPGAAESAASRRPTANGRDPWGS